MLKTSYIEVEPFFDEVISRAGGYRVDTLISRSPTFKNTDYYFESEGVFAELKILEHDSGEDNRLKERLVALYTEYARIGRVPPVAPMQRFARSELLPIEAQWRLLEPLKRRLQSPVKTAARQLKATKKAFNRTNDSGLLVLVNEGSALYRPSHVFYFLHHLFRGGYSNIDHIIYCSVNVAATIPGFTDGDALVWSDAAVQGRKHIPARFLTLLKSCWRAVLQRRLGFRLPTIKFDNDPSLLHEVIFHRSDIRTAKK